MRNDLTTFGRLGRWLAGGASILLCLVVWEAIAWSGLLPPLLWPSLEAVARELWKMVLNGDLLYHGGITLKRALVGFAGAIVAGVLMGTLLGTSTLVRRLIEPVFIFGYPIPKISLYPVFIFVFGFGDWSKIVLVFLECLYPITLQTLAGLRNTDRVLVWAAQNAGASRTDIFWKVLVPSAAPSIFAGIRIALPVSLIVAIITEIIGESRGLGYVVSFASASFEPARAMAAFAVIAIIGFVFDRGLSAVRAKVLFWERNDARLA